MEEIIILNGKQRVIAVGKAVLSGDEMKAFKRGVAVKVRRGNLEKVKKPTKK
jgi:archaeosine-15-forming tRNA-guanine transglycosylase